MYFKYYLLDIIPYLQELPDVLGTLYFPLSIQDHWTIDVPALIPNLFAIHTLESQCEQTLTHSQSLQPRPPIFSDLSSQENICWTTCIPLLYLTVDSESVIRKEAIGFFHEEIPSNEFLETPVFPLDKFICSLALCRDEGSRNKKTKLRKHDY
jgi:hypothetical protein